MSKLHFETLQVHAGQETPDPATGARAVPIYQTTSYVFLDCQDAEDRFALRRAGNIYSRLTNPTVGILEQRMAALENGAAALGLASGMSAILVALQALAGAGDHIVSQRTLYGGSFDLLSQTLQRQGVTTTFVDTDKPEEVAAAFRENTKALYIESMGNPRCNLTDIELMAKIAHEHGVPLVVDNTFATPYLLRPLDLGADLVVHSATKFIGGHGAAMGGIVVDACRFDFAASKKYPWLTEPDPGYGGRTFVGMADKAACITYMRAALLRDEGPCMAPFNAFLLLQGLESLSLRVERHVENALKVVDFLAHHPKVERVYHPSLPDAADNALYRRYFPRGAGSIFMFDIRGGAREARTFVDSLELFSLLANVADAKSLAIHPATTTHAQVPAEDQAKMGIRPGSVRLSIGIEHIDDLIADISQALDAVKV